MFACATEFTHVFSYIYFSRLFVQNFTTSVESVHLSDLLQTIELSWNNAYIGTRNGRILVYDTQVSDKKIAHETK